MGKRRVVLLICMYKLLDSSASAYIQFDCMEIDFDAAKNEKNIAKHGVALAEAERFEWETAVIREDVRLEYGEQRFEAVGYIGPRLHVMIYCLRVDAVRIISLRKANSREVDRYAKT